MASRFSLWIGEELLKILCSVWEGQAWLSGACNSSGREAGKKTRALWVMEGGEEGRLGCKPQKREGECETEVRGYVRWQHGCWEHDMAGGRSPGLLRSWGLGSVGWQLSMAWFVTGASRSSGLVPGGRAGGGGGGSGV